MLQILNKNDGVFDAKDEFVAQALAAQAAVVIHRAKITEQIIASEPDAKTREALSLLSYGSAVEVIRLASRKPGECGQGVVVGERGSPIEEREEVGRQVGVAHKPVQQPGGVILLPGEKGKKVFLDRG